MLCPHALQRSQRRLPRLSNVGEMDLTPAVILRLYVPRLSHRSSANVVGRAAAFNGSAELPVRVVEQLCDNALTRQRGDALIENPVNHLLEDCPAALIGQRVEKVSRDLTSAYLRHGPSLQRGDARLQAACR